MAWPVQFETWLSQHVPRRVMALTGAGMSAESGIPTFRGRDGLWRGMDPTALFTPDALRNTPELTWQMYDELRTRIARAEPNAGHRALATPDGRLEITLATQNIDGLHQRAGSREVLELHGSVWRLCCEACGFTEENREAPLLALPPRCPECACLLRPDIVLFTEALPVQAFTQAVQAAESCDLMLVIGTSGVVYPAAGLPGIARAHGAVVAEINPQETSLTKEVEFAVRAPAAIALPRIMRLLAGGG